MRRTLLVLIIVAQTQPSVGQAVRDWVRTYPGYTGYAYVGWGARLFAVDDSGNTYVTGRDSRGTTEYSVLTFKCDRSGDLKWARVWNGVWGAQGVAVAVDHEGSVYVLALDATDTYPNEYMYHLIKYDSDGTLLWAATPPPKVGPWCPAQWYELYRIEFDAVGGIYAALYAQDVSDSLNPALRTLLTKMSHVDGHVQWHVAYGPAEKSFILYDFRTDESGNSYVAGRQGNAGFGELLVAKVLPGGGAAWLHTYGFPASKAFTIADAMNIDANGNMFVGLADGLGPTKQSTLLKFNSSGALEWTDVRADRSGFLELLPDEHDGVYALCHNPWSIRRYDPSGDVLWEKSLEHYPFYGTVDSTGCLYVTSIYYNDELSGAPAKIDTIGRTNWIYARPSGEDGGSVLGIGVDVRGNVYIGASWALDSTRVERLSQAVIIRPAASEKWISGQIDTIRWRDPGWPAKNIKVVLNEGTTVQQTELVAANVTRESTYGWAIPNSLFSYKTRIIIENAADPSQKIQSDIFRLKPYHLTYFNSDSTYRPYMMELDAWGFANTRIEMWPESFWRPRFDYQGIDPFTDVEYSQVQAGGAFALAKPDTFPDWVSFVNAFGINACYLDLENAVYNPVAVLLWARIVRTWGGSCFGIATSNAMVFLNREGFLSLYPSFPLYAEPITVASDNFVIRTVTELHTHQFGNPTRDRRLFGRSMSPNQTLEELRALLSEDVARMRTLSFYNTRGPGGHNVLGYRMEREAPPSSNYRVFVYDSNFPGNRSASILIDTLALFGIGSWTTLFDYPGWGGFAGLFLEVPAENYFFDASLPKRGNPSPQTASAFAVPDSLLEVLVAAGADVVITDAAGNSTGLVDGAVKTEIPGSNALCSFDGQETPPYGYLLKNDAFLLRLDSAQSGRTGLTLRTGNRLFSYDRNDAGPGETDLLSYDGSVNLANPDPAVKSARFLSVASEPSQAKLFALREVLLQQNDSVGIESVGEGNLRFRSYGGARTYDLEINHAAPGGLGRFVASGITLGANTAHTIVPEWADLDQIPVTILIDESNDGTIDDTIRITNTASDVGRGDLHGVPADFALFQNYPNPFNASTIIRYALPYDAPVRLSVFDLLGREVALLVHGDQEKGYHEVSLDASALASGVYLCRLVAGDFVAAKRMILLK